MGNRKFQEVLNEISSSRFLEQVDIKIWRLHQRNLHLRIEDYELKVSIRLRSRTRVLRRKGGAMLLPYMDVTSNQTE